MRGYVEAAEAYFRSKVARKSLEDLAAEYVELDVLAVLLAFAGAAERCGATILQGASARRIVVDGGRVVGVDTDAGYIA